MRLSGCLAAVLSLTVTCLAQLPDYYKTVNRVTWVVGNIDKVRPAWTALGLSDIKEYVNIHLVGEYHGKPVTIYAWQITGHQDGVGSWASGRIHDRFDLELLGSV